LLQKAFDETIKEKIGVFEQQDKGNSLLSFYFCGCVLSPSFQALNVYWLTTNLISIMQSRILRLKPIREKLGIGEMIRWQEKDLPMNQMSIFR